MGNKNNVINFKDYANKRAVKEGDPKEKIFPKDPAEAREPAVIDLTERRGNVEDSERRAVARTILSQFIGVFVVLPDKGLQPVSLFDVSEGGLAFDLPLERGGFNLAEQVTLRIYLSHDTYFSFTTKVVNRRPAEAEGVMRHGAVFSKNDVSFKTLFYFTKFLENVSQIARKDTGDRLMGRID